MTTREAPSRGMIHRDPTATERERFDLIIIGGGVYGISLALESAARGLRPLLLERGDFGEETSAATLRILHGGLRYLQSLDLIRFRESVRERRWWIRTFPTLVAPLPCLLPLYGDGPRRRVIVAPALLLNDLLSADRNRGVAPELVLPPSRTLGRNETIDLFPSVRAEGLEGAALWYDASMESPHRLLVEMLRWAALEGAVALNYLEATELLREGDRIAGVRGLDRLHGTELGFRAPLVVNAAGSSTPRVAQLAGAADAALFRPSLAFNVLLRRSPPSKFAVGVHAPDGSAQTYFLRPHGKFTFAGTGHVPWHERSEPPTRTPDSMIATFLEEIRRAVPSFDVTPADVVREFRGLLPAAKEGTSVLARRPVIRDHSRNGGPTGLYSVAGVKFTTAPGVARLVLDRAFGPAPTRREEFLAHPPAFPARMTPKLFGRLREGSPERAAAYLRSTVSEESVAFEEDLVLGRLDWGLDLEDAESASLDLAGLPGAPALPRRTTSLP